MTGETNTDRQTDTWMGINGLVTVAVILSKLIFFPAANIFMHMFSMSVMSLQSIRLL